MITFPSWQDYGIDRGILRRDQVNAIECEADRAERRFGPFRSSHEGFGVLSEEVAELLAAIRSNKRESIREEAHQVAAVALRIAESMSHPDVASRSGCE